MKLILLSIIIVVLLIPIFNTDSIIAKRTTFKDIAPFYWGPILYKSISLNHNEYIFNGDEWGIDYVFSYFILGLGHHIIYWESEWDVYTENYTKHFKETYNRSEYIWTFRFTKPLIKLLAFNTIHHTFDLYDNGIFSSSVYIDDILIWNKTISYDYWEK